MRTATVIVDKLAEYNLIDVGQRGGIHALLVEWGAEIVKECAESAEYTMEELTDKWEVPDYIDAVTRKGVYPVLMRSTILAVIEKIK